MEIGQSTPKKRYQKKSPNTCSEVRRKVLLANGLGHLEARAPMLVPVRAAVHHPKMGNL